MTKKIMVVDDDPAIVDYIVQVLTYSGYETCTAAHGLEAFDMLKQEKPDLITLDLEMNEEWGPRFYRRCMKDEEFKHIPVIVISGLPSSQYAIKKAAASLSKPFDPDELLATIRKILGE